VQYIKLATCQLLVHSKYICYIVSYMFYKKYVTLASNNRPNHMHSTNENSLTQNILQLLCEDVLYEFHQQKSSFMTSYKSANHQIFIQLWKHLNSYAEFSSVPTVMTLAVLQHKHSVCTTCQHRCNCEHLCWQVFKTMRNSAPWLGHHGSGLHQQLKLMIWVVGTRIRHVV